MTLDSSSTWAPLSKIKDTKPAVRIFQPDSLTPHYVLPPVRVSSAARTVVVAAVASVIAETPAATAVSAWRRMQCGRWRAIAQADKEEVTRVAPGAITFVGPRRGIPRPPSPPTAPCTLAPTRGLWRSLRAGLRDGPSRTTPP